MAAVARNAPCPCGSGRKHKLCCGTTRAQEGEQRRVSERRADAFEQLVNLPMLFPLLRPESLQFEDWAAAQEGRRIERTTIEYGRSFLRERERQRIRGSYAAANPIRWNALVTQSGEDEAGAREAVLVGAVVAALCEERRPSQLGLELVEDGLADDGVDALALCLDACDLWSPVEAAAAAEAVDALPEWLGEEAHTRHWEAAIGAVAERVGEARHRRRLELLVRRLERELPVLDFPYASMELREASTAFRRSRRLRRRLAAELLADSLGPLRALEPALAA